MTPRVRYTQMLARSLVIVLLINLAPTVLESALGAPPPHRVPNHRAVPKKSQPDYVTASAALAYSSYLGPVTTHVSSIAVDSAGSVYATGNSYSPAFPTTAGALNQTGAGIFVLKLSPDGGSVIYSGHIAGAQDPSIAIDSQGNAYITGGADSRFSTTPGAFQTMLAGQSTYAAFVAKLNPAGSALVYATLLGGADGLQAANDIAVDSAGNAYVTGDTTSHSFPTTAGSFQPTKPPSLPPDPSEGHVIAHSGFVTKLNSSGSGLIYSTYLGGDGYTNAGSSIAIDNQGDAFVAGATDSISFPTTAGAFQTAKPDPLATDAYVAKLDPSGSKLLYCTLVGGDGEAGATAIAIDAAGNASITGTTTSTSFPVVRPVQPRLSVGAVLKSESEAAVFRVIDNGMSRGFQPSAIVVDPTNPATLYAAGWTSGYLGTANIFKSLDGGATWTPIDNGLPSYHPAVSGLAIDPKTPATLYAAVADFGPGGPAPSPEFGPPPTNRLYKSSDGGQSWSPLPIALQAGLNTPIVVDPQNTSTIYFFGVLGNLYFTTAPRATGPFKSSDGGATWTAIANGLSSQNCRSMVINPVDTSVLYLGTAAGIFKSVDGGAKWKPTIVTADTRALATDPSQPDTLYASTAQNATQISVDLGPQSGMLKSLDGGANWVPIDAGLDQAHGLPAVIGVDPQNSGIVYAGTPVGVYKSADAGGHWQQTPSYMIDTRAIAFDPSDSSIVYFNGQGRGYGYNAFAARINAAGSGLIYSTYLGGTAGSHGTSVALDAAGNAYVGGWTESLDFPTSSNALQRQWGGMADAFITVLNLDGSLSLSTYLGGSGFEVTGGARSLALDSSGNIYAGGLTTSLDFPTINALQPAAPPEPPGVSGAGFVTKLGMAGPPPGPGSLLITGASITGKKLLVRGTGFQPGSVILIDGQPQPTLFNAAGPILVAKRGVKAIAPLQTVALQIQNPDGAVSNGFLFNRD